MRLPATNQKAPGIFNRIARPSMVLLIEMVLFLNPPGQLDPVSQLFPMIPDDLEEVNDMTILVTKDLMLNWVFAEKARSGPAVWLQVPGMWREMRDDPGCPAPLRAGVLEQWFDVCMTPSHSSTSLYQTAP